MVLLAVTTPLNGFVTSVYGSGIVPLKVTLYALVSPTERPAFVIYVATVAPEIVELLVTITDVFKLVEYFTSAEFAFAPITVFHPFIP